MTKELHSLREFRELTGIKVAKANEIANSKHGGFIKIGGKWYITSENLRKKYGISVKQSVAPKNEDEMFKERVNEAIYEFFKTVIRDEDFKRSLSAE